MIKFYPIVVAILGFALPGGGTPSVIAALGASGSPSYGGINPTKLEDGGKDNKVSQLAFASPPRGGFFLVPAPKPQEFSFSVTFIDPLRGISSFTTPCFLLFLSCAPES